MDIITAAATSILLFAALQLLMAGWRDLGPVTIVCGGILALLAPGPALPGALAAAALIAALAWARAARLGVGHPAHNGLALALALAGVALVPLLEGRLPQARVVLASAEGGLGALVAVMALRRPTSRRPMFGRSQVRWKGDIPVQGPTPPAESASAPSRSPGAGAG
jgi:hypothetical protein